MLVCCNLYSTDSLHAEILRLKATAEVNTSVVRLGDIADVLHADPEQVTRMQAMVLQPAPPQGRTQVITISQIRGRLQALGVDLSQLELTGRSQVRVSTQKVEQESARPQAVTTQQDQEQAEQKIQQAMTDWIRSSYPDSKQFSLTVRLPRDNVRQVLDNRADMFRFAGLDQLLETEQAVGMKLLDAQGQVHEMRIICQLKRIPEILAAKYTLNKGTVVRADDLVWMRPEKSQTGITDPRLVIGRELTRTVYQSHVMRSQDLIEVPLIRDGAIVTVYARRGGISVRREMRAQGTGGMGDPITLIALEGRDRLMATVTGYNQAEVNYRPTNEVQPQNGIQFISGSSEAAVGNVPSGNIQNAGGYAIRRGGIRK
ncbi:flagellar basal body P-ring biosynthesis protein FlgA [Gimesia algae]|uniref:Flagellar basal body P-ring biosynthesis protein FlgA n=2 Tax=Gimesia algae TaxID=2527971 RepID=A0A517VDC4_9PLAN|nr:flagellar basal body P-ring biosynthesis protein FlgA [Gimesia algae]